MNQIWHDRKIGQGQSRVIIGINLVVLKYTMLHTNFQGHRPFGSREEDFSIFFYPIWAWQPYWSCDLDRLNILSYPHPMKTPLEIWLQLSPAVSKEKKFENFESE